MVSGTFEIPLVCHIGRRITRHEAPDARVAFIGDDANRLVESVLQSLFETDVAKGLAHDWKYNPLVICGASGTGKSLLANCIGGLWQSEIERHNLDQSIMVLSAADWARNYAQAVNDKRVPAWRANCRATSMLILDDLQLLRNRDNAQRELVDFIDDLVESNIPIITTNPIASSASQDLQPRLASRLSSGLTLELNPPGPHARRRIVDFLARAQHQPLTPEAASWFAEKLTGTVPIIRGALAGCLARSERSAGDQLAISQSQLRQLFDHWQMDLGIPIKVITRVVSRYCQTSQKDMLGASRKKPVVQSRSMAMFLAKKFSGCSLREIGRHFGDRDHTTVLHACNKVTEACDNDPSMRLAMDELQHILSNERKGI